MVVATGSWEGGRSRDRSKWAHDLGLVNHVTFGDLLSVKWSHGNHMI